MDQTNRLCLCCQKRLKGRIDKKFCNDFCRNHFNNLRHADRDDYVRLVHAVLRKNRRILYDIMRSIDTPVNIPRQKLLDKGYDFSFFTNQLQTPQGMYTFCYEFGFLHLDGQWLLLVKRKE
jgi:hypothetical protein